MIYALRPRAVAQGIDHAHQGGCNRPDRPRTLAKDIQPDRENKEVGANELTDQLRAQGVIRAAAKLIRADNTEHAGRSGCSEQFIASVGEAPTKAHACTGNINSKRNSWIEASA